MIYFPYLRSKQNELLALKELDNVVFNNTIPLIEPHSLSPSTIKKIVYLAENDKPFILIINPKIKSAPSQRNIIDKLCNISLAEFTNYEIGYIISKDTILTDLNNILSKFAEINLIHFEEVNEHIIDLINNSSSVKRNFFYSNKLDDRYINLFLADNKVLLEDNFRKQKKNADYPLESEFSNTPFTYNTNGYIGFGDFQTIGNHFSEKGGRTVAVTIHYTHIIDNRYTVKHFVSDNRNGFGREAEKFSEALHHLVNFCNEENTQDTLGKNDFIDLNNRGHYPGLGVVKKHSIKHHIELVSNNIL